MVKYAYSKNDLLYIARLYNKYTNNHIKTSKMNKLELWNEINNRLKIYVIINYVGLNKNIYQNIFMIKSRKNFKPKMPKSWFKNINEWLSTLEIEDVMNQYDKKYKNFKFLGAVPSDCPKSIRCSLTNLNLKGFLKQKITKLGIVFNLDEHHQSGSHWVALMIDLSHKNSILSMILMVLNQIKI